jgi:acyl carrier protein
VNGNQDLLRAVLDVLRSEGHLSADLPATQDTPLSGEEADLTSLDLLRVLVTLEEVLDIELDDAAIMNAHFATVGDLVAVVARPADRVATSVGGQPGGDDAP